MLDRAGWVDANVVSMRNLLAPLTARVGERIARSPLAPIGRTVTATELGVLLGWFSQRVLGQYDLLVPDDDAAPIDDAVYYVGPNVLALEKRYAFRPRDFRLWIALARVHAPRPVHRRAVAAAVLPLARERLARLDRSRSRTVVHRAARRAEEMRHGRNPLDDGGLAALLARRAPRHDRPGAVADDAARGPRQPRDERARGAPRRRAGPHGARARRPASHAAAPPAFFHKLIGLEAKLRQYEVGEAFVAAIEAAGSAPRSTPRGAAPSGCPTAEELEDPHALARRVA